MTDFHCHIEPPNIPMTDHHNTTVDAIRSIVSYVAALLGIGC